MIIADYAALQSEVIEWSHRRDTSFAARVPGYIDLAERELFRELVLRNIEASVTGTTSGATIAVPPGLSAFERIKIEANGHEYTLDYTSPAGTTVLTGSTNQPTRFHVEDGVVNLLSAPDGPYTYTIYYIPVLEPLSDTNTTNWLLDNHADLYLKASLLQVAKFTNNQADIARLTQETGVALDSVKRADERKRFPISGGLQIKPRGYR